MKSKYYVVVAVLMVVSFLLGFVSGMPTELEPTVKNEVITNAPVENESEWRNSFVQGCVEEGLTEKECVCMYEWFRARYTIGEMAQMAVELESEATQSVFDEVIPVCSREND